MVIKRNLNARFVISRKKTRFSPNASTYFALGLKNFMKVLHLKSCRNKNFDPVLVINVWKHVMKHASENVLNATRILEETTTIKYILNSYGSLRNPYFCLFHWNKICGKFHNHLIHIKTYKWFWHCAHP